MCLLLLIRSIDYQLSVVNYSLLFFYEWALIIIYQLLFTGCEWEPFREPPSVRTSPKSRGSIFRAIGIQHRLGPSCPEIGLNDVIDDLFMDLVGCCFCFVYRGSVRQKNQTICLTFSALFGIVWFIICLKWLIKAWGWIPIMFVNIFGTFKEIGTLDPLLPQKYF